MSISVNKTTICKRTGINLNVFNSVYLPLMLIDARLLIGAVALIKAVTEASAGLPGLSKKLFIKSFVGVTAVRLQH